MSERDYADDITRCLGSEQAKTAQLLCHIRDNPDRFTMTTYEREALTSNQPGLYDSTKHSLYVIYDNQTGERYTVSYNGTSEISPVADGQWLTNTDTDIESAQNPQAWSMQYTTPGNGINASETAGNILEMMLSQSSNEGHGLDYWAGDHVWDWDNAYNCNTALQNTVVENQYSGSWDSGTQAGGVVDLSSIGGQNIIIDKSFSHVSEYYETVNKYFSKLVYINKK